MRFFLKNSGIIVLIFLSSTVYCQLNETEFADKFNTYVNKAFQEKLFIHTDKEFYVAGEILWFKVYYVNGSSHQALQLSKLAYAEVLDEKNEPVLQAKISLESGECNGSFYLPVSLNTGHYTLRAYTNWMKNFDEAYFFEKKITIVNTLKNPELSSGVDSSVVAINFFPEGGNLVNGLQSRVGFTITADTGSINDAHGFIISNRGDTITSFNPLKFGIGSFDLKPETGISYKAVIGLPGGSVINKMLPPAYDYGYIMKVSEKDQQQVIVTVRRRKMPGEQNTTQILLAAHTRQVLKLAQKSFINDEDSVLFVIDRNKLDKGVTNFTLFNGNDKPVCERLFFIKPEQEISLSIESDHKVYTNRQKIELSLNTFGNSNNQGTLNLSASVFYLDTLQRAPESNIFNYMWLTSDMAGHVEAPGYYFSDEPGVAMATDNLMLTHGWRRFKWDDIWKGDDSFVKCLPEINGHLVTGRVTDTRNEQPIPHINAYLSVPGRPFGFYSSRSDENGLVRFEVKNYYGNGRIIAQRGMETDSFYTVTILKPFAVASPRKKYNPYRLTEEIKEQLLQRSIGMQVQNIYTGDSLRNFREPLLNDTLPFYGLPQFSYKLDDYKRFITMEEVLREYVREIGVGLRNGKLIFKIFNPEAHDFYNEYELVLLDGVALPANTIFSYDPLKVKKLDIIQSRYVLGQSIFNGVASFSTYDGAFDGYELDPKLIAIDYAGLQLQREFYSPRYETKEQLEKRIPDFRNTLLWSPAIITDINGKASLEFYSSDRTGKYIVVIQGMNEKGNFVAGQTVFEVR